MWRKGQAGYGSVGQRKGKVGRTVDGSSFGRMRQTTRGPGQDMEGVGRVGMDPTGNRGKKGGDVPGGDEVNRKGRFGEG